MGGDVTQMIGGQVTVNIDGTGRQGADGHDDPRGGQAASASASRRSATTRTCAWPACAACASSRSRASGRCRRPAPIPITGSLKVKTHTRKVRQARRHILDLLLSTHYGECYTCKRNNNCELQSLAKEYGVDFFRFGHVHRVAATRWTSRATPSSAT